uniref:Prolyl 4-hydroxylase 1 n=1 Tax=Rhizophora mucronata TaxID=61149 RepID=A0A2P2K8S2_RHIMU
MHLWWEGCKRVVCKTSKGRRDSLLEHGVRWTVGHEQHTWRMRGFIRGEMVGYKMDEAKKCILTSIIESLWVYEKNVSLHELPCCT